MYNVVHIIQYTLSELKIHTCFSQGHHPNLRSLHIYLGDPVQMSRILVHIYH